MFALAWPSKKVRDIFYNNKNVIFIDDKGFWEFNDNSSKRILLTSINQKEKSLNEPFDIVKARRDLNWWAPMWTRWISHAEQYEFVREKSLISIYEIFHMLKFYKIEYIIFHTAIAHHLNSSILSIACCLARIKQIYLYAESINARLLPTIQTGDIGSRVPINFEVSDFDTSKTIENFLINKMNFKAPAHQSKNAKWKENLLIAIFFSLIINTVKKIKKDNSYRDSKKSIFPLNISANSFIEDLRVLNNQRSYLKMFSNYKISNESLKKLKLNNKPKILIAAHFQPEASSFPEGYNYHNHIDLIISIRNKKYKEKIIYKEHFASNKYLDYPFALTKVGVSRSRSYIELLQNYGCIFLDSNYQLSINEDFNWYIPVTISGTIAIERSLAGLHTIYAGNPWYRGMPGTIYIDDIKSLEEIPIEWTNLNKNIANDSKIFLNNLLNNKTIVNLQGISNGLQDNSEKGFEDFKKSIFKIIQNLNY